MHSTSNARQCLRKWMHHNRFLAVAPVFTGHFGLGITSIVAIVCLLGTAVLPCLFPRSGMAQDAGLPGRTQPRPVLLGKTPGGVVDALDISPGGSQLAVVVNGHQNMVKIYETDSGKVVRNLFGYVGESLDGLITAVKFSPDGRWLFVAVKERENAAIRIYKTADFLTKDRIDQRIFLQSGGFIRGMAFSRDCDRFVSWDYDNKFQFWALEGTRWRMKREVDFGRSRLLRYVEVQENPRLLWVRFRDTDRDVHEFWSMDRFEDYELLEPLKVKSLRPRTDAYVRNFEQLHENANPVSNIVGRILDDAETDSFCLILMENAWAICRQKRANEPERYELIKRPEGFATIRRFAYDATSNRIALADGEGFVTIEQISAQGVKGIREMKAGGINQITIEGDQNGLEKGSVRWRAGGPGGERLRFDLKNVDVRSADGHDPQQNREGRRDGPRSVFFANSGDPIPFSNAEDRTRVGANFYRGVMQYRDTDRPNLNFDMPMRIASATLGDAELGQIAAVFPSLALLGATRPVIASTELSTITLLNPEAQRSLRTFTGHSGTITGFGISQANRRLISGASDGTVRIWSLEDHRPVAFPDFLADPQTGIVVWVPSGSRASAVGVRPGDHWLGMNGIPSDECFRRYFDSSRSDPSSWGFRKEDIVRLQLKRGDREFDVDMNLPADEDIVKPLVSVYAEDSLTWVAWTEEGYFESGPRGGQLIRTFQP